MKDINTLTLEEMVEYIMTMEIDDEELQSI